MENQSNNNYPQTHPFASFMPGGPDETGLRAATRAALERLRNAGASLRSALPKDADEVAEENLVCPYLFDDFGGPRILSGIELRLRSIAWHLVVLMTIVFGLTISCTAMQIASQNNAPLARAASVEVTR